MKYCLLEVPGLVVGHELKLLFHNSPHLYPTNGRLISQRQADRLENYIYSNGIYVVASIAGSLK